MLEADLDRVAEIARIAFPHHSEGRPLFANRLALAPQGCFVLADGSEPAMGYAVSYPWRRDSAPSLNTLIEAIPEGADVIYLHDLAIHPDARGVGATRAIVERLIEQARDQGWPALTLVAVNDAVAFWSRYGFAVRETPEMTAKLLSYGPDARYMVRAL